MTTDQFPQDETEQRTAPDWWHRDHPTFTALTGFFTGMLFVTLVPGGFVGLLRLLFAYDTAEELFPLVLISLVVPIALLIAPRTRRFGVYMLIGMVAHRAGGPRRRLAGPLLPGPELTPRRRRRFRAGPPGWDDRRRCPTVLPPSPPARRRCRWSSTSRAAARSRRATSPTSTADERAELATSSWACPGFRAKQLSHPLLRPAGRRPGRDDRPAGRPARRAGRRAAAAADDAAAHARGRPRHHPQDPVAALRRRARRVGADALPRPGHDVRVQPGRLRHGLPVLRHRPGRPAAQHVHRRDRRAGRRRRPLAGARRGARVARAASPTSSSWAWASRWPTTRP